MGGLILDGLMMLRVRSVNGIIRSQQSCGKLLSVPLQVAMKWDLKAWIARSAGF